MYWCYIDESWPDTLNEKVGVLAAAVGPQEAFERLDRFMYQMRRKYYSEEHARDRGKELKGADIFSSYSFKMEQKYGFSKNLCIGREVFEWVAKSDIRLIGVSVYASTQPSLLTHNSKDLSRPFRELCLRAKAAVPVTKRGVMVFDQRVGAQEGITIGIYHYLAGMADNHTLSPYPLIGVSNVLAGLQLADMAAYVLGRWATGDDRCRLYYRLVSNCQLRPNGQNGLPLFGLIRLQHQSDGSYTVRRERTRP